MGDQISVWHVVGPPDRPRLVRDGVIEVPEYRLPSGVPQEGTDRRLDSSDTRLTQAVSNEDPAHGDRRLIWTQHTVAGPGEASDVRWYALDPARLSLVEHGTIHDARHWVFTAAISPTARGDAAIVDDNVGAPDLLPQIRAQVGGEPGSERTLGCSAAPHASCDPPPGDPYCRWGDYAGASPDPAEPGVVWGTNQTMAPRGEADAFGVHWRSRNFARRPRGRASPVEEAHDRECAPRPRSVALLRTRAYGRRVVNRSCLARRAALPALLASLALGAGAGAARAAPFIYVANFGDTAVSQYISGALAAKSGDHFGRGGEGGGGEPGGRQVRLWPPHWAAACSSTTSGPAGCSHPSSRRRLMPAGSGFRSPLP